MATISKSFVDIKHDRSSNIPAGTATIHISEEVHFPATFVVTRFPDNNSIDIDRESALKLIEETTNGNSYFNVIGDDVFEVRPNGHCTRILFASDEGSPAVTISNKDFTMIVETLREWLSK